MIKAKHDGQYKQVGFIKVRQPDGTYKDVEKKYGKTTGGEYGLVFEKGFTREAESELPLTLNGIGKSLKDYTLYGNTYQSDGVLPDTPQEVVGSGDRTGNLWNEDYSLINGSTIQYVPVYVGDGEYTLSTTSPLQGNSSAVLYLMAGKVETGATGESKVYIDNPLTVEAIEGYVTVAYRHLAYGGDTKPEVDPRNYQTMLNLGSTPLPYEPYGHKADVECRGKNLWNLQSSYSFTTYYDINVNINAGHYLSYIIETNGTTDVRGGTGCQLTFSDNTTQYVFSNATYRKSILLSKDVKIVRVYAGKDYNTSVGFTATVSEIMVSANADDSYEPYTPPIITPIYLDSPLYKIGDYADSRGKTEEVRAIKELVLTGEESWYYTSDYDLENTVRFHSSPILSDRQDTTLDLCSHFERMDYNSLNVTNKQAFSMANGIQLVFRMSKTKCPTVADWKDYLAEQYNNGTPVKVYYVLSTPETKTVEPVEIPTLNGTTVIDVDTEVKPSNMWVEYKSSK